MNRPKPGNPIDISQLVTKLDSARGSIARDADKDHYDRHHDERSDLDTVFDDLIDWVRAHQAKAELTKLVKPASDPALQPGDLIVVNGSPATVREIRSHAPRSHADSGLPQHQAATEIVTGNGSQWFSLAPQV
ncbi:hypothetical protein ACIBBE_46570 [Streptomyces sp. NPDC051644]|uniref:hypothetical protein n=1 Tax=Streptomyces sp. NPDC051644 TaxID=3365666 RepID=UPI0037983EB1